MKNSYHLAIAAAIVGGISTVHGDVTIRLTGSTAFRAAVFNALKNGNFFDSTPSTVPSGASTSTSVVTFVGTKSALFPGQNLIVECAYSGSVEGLLNVLNLPQSSAPGSVAQPSFLLQDGTTDPITVADYAFSDVAQDTTKFSAATYGAAVEYGAGVTNYPGRGVGVVTFSFVKNNGVNTNTLQNITSAQFQQLAGVGKLSRGFFLGNTNDSAQVYLAGRYQYSGTRLSVNADSGLSANANQRLYAGTGPSPFTSGNGMRIITSAIQGGTTNVDYQGGFISGGKVANLLNNASMTNLVISYLGLGDVRSGNLGNFQINFNGVAATRDNTVSGAYSFWSYERIYGNVNGQTSDAIKFMNGNTSNVQPIDSNGFINKLDVALQSDLDYVSLRQMKATRAGDGGVVSPSF